MNLDLNLRHKTLCGKEALSLLVVMGWNLVTIKSIINKRAIFLVCGMWRVNRGRDKTAVLRRGEVNDTGRGRTVTVTVYTDWKHLADKSTDVNQTAEFCCLPLCRPVAWNGLPPALHDNSVPLNIDNLYSPIVGSSRRNKPLN